MSTPRIEPLQNDALAPLAALERFDTERTFAIGRATRIIENVRTLVEESQALTELAERVYVGEFIPDAQAAAEAALDLAEGRGNLDLSSFGGSTDEQQIRDYLAPLQIQDPSASYPFPRLWLPATAVMPFCGKEFTFDPNGYFKPLTQYSALPTFRPDLQLPQLVDPQPRTFAEFAELSKLDPSHAEQVFEAYTMAATEQAEEHPGLHFKDPIIIRAVAALPVGEDYMTDFLPRIELADKDTVWDPRLVVGGALNPAGNFLHTDVSYAKDRIVYSVDGREAVLRISRPKPGERDIERDMSVVPKTDHEYHSMAVILFPYKQIKVPRESISTLGGASLSSGGPKSYRPADVGDANISAGSTGYFSADKRTTNIFGDRMVPVTGGQPLIYSVRLFTASASR